MEFTITIPRIPQNFSPIHRTLTKIHASSSSKYPNSQLPLPSKSLLTPRGENIPTMSEILAAGEAQNLHLRLQTLGPFFRITAKSLESQREVGKAEGLVRVWLRGRILHLDSIRLNRESLGMEKSIFGLGLFIGAVAIRYGYDCGCKTAELLAINDSDLYHSKVRFLSLIFHIFLDWILLEKKQGSVIFKEMNFFSKFYIFRLVLSSVLDYYYHFGN